MTINSELLKEAIADAKAVRATALANAKAALEEAFAPRFEAMFAEKLKEESEEDETKEPMKEVEAPNQIHGASGEAKGPKTKAVSKGEPKKMHSGDDFKAVKAGVGPKDVPKLSQPVMETKEEDDEEGKKMDEQYEEEGKMEEAGLTSEDLDEIIKELEAEVSGDEEHHEPSPEEGLPHEEPHVDGEVGEAPTVAPTVAPAPVDGCPASEPAPVAPEAPVGDEEEHVPEVPAAPVARDTDDEEINLDELLAALNEESEEDEEGKKDMDENKDHGVPKNVGGQDKSNGTNTYPKGPDASKKQLPGKNHNIMGKGNIGDGPVGGKPMEEATKYKVALKEAYSTIEYLRGQINEVNLLNAKLLYTNKLFKEFAGVLDDPYRMKIVEAFDLTKSVREVKLAYALLAESLNFGTKVSTSKSAQVKKPVAEKAVVKQITEGLASKSVASTKPKELISEGNEMALRFKKLAGIKDAVKK